jgi:hypothetical protein
MAQSEFGDLYKLPLAANGTPLSAALADGADPVDDNWMSVVKIDAAGGLELANLMTPTAAPIIATEVYQPDHKYFQTGLGDHTGETVEE